jgi:hypothetical protein
LSLLVLVGCVAAAFVIYKSQSGGGGTEFADNAAQVAGVADTAAPPSTALSSAAMPYAPAREQPVEPANVSSGDFTAERLASDTREVIPTKIIYTAEIELVVGKLDQAKTELLKQVKARRGYVAEMTVNGTEGSPREGTWKLRIPVTQYDAFVADISRLGEVKSIQVSSEDVGEEYYDTTARVKAKRVEEQRLLGHLQRSTAKLQDILAVERELTRVRGEIEQMEGRLRYLTNQTELTTITLTVHEAASYVPPKPDSLGTQISRTFGSSIGVLKSTGKAVLLTLVAAVPWFLVLGLLSLLIWPFARRRFRHPKEEPSSA